MIGGSLCTGYGGLDMAVAQVLGVDFAWHAEIDEAPARVLAHHYPGVPNLGDIKATDWRAVAPVRVLTAGYPCQGFSDAGKRLAEEDPRYLWPYVARAVGVLRPALVVLENVRGHLARGFGTVLGDLADLGYDARWCCIPASAVGAAHRRLRVFVAAADAQGDGWHEGWAEPAGQLGRRDVALGGGEALAHPDRSGRRPDLGDVHGRPPHADWGSYGPAIERWTAALGRPAPEPTIVGQRGQPKLSPFFVEWLMGLPAGHVTAPEIGLTVNQQLKALGNGVVPQQAAAALWWLLTPMEQAA